MHFSFFKAVRGPGDWELGIFALGYELRIGRSQFALWRVYPATGDGEVFNFLYGPYVN